MQSLLSLRDTTASRHENAVEEIGVTVMQFSTELCQCTRKQGTECLFLAGSDVTENTNILREDVLSCSENGDGVDLGGGYARGIRRHVINRHLLKLSENAANLETFLEIVVL